MRGRWITLVGLLALACGERHASLTLPTVDNARTAIVGAGARGFVVDLDAPDEAILLDVEEGTVAGVAYYDAPIDALALRAGPIVPPADDGRPIPEAARYFASEPIDGPSAGWQEVDEPPDALQTLRLASFDAARCAAGGGCWSDGLAVCRPDCVPGAVVPPTPPDITCPDGWLETTVDDEVRFCDPMLASRPSCGSNERETVDGSCVEVGSTCAADGWPVGPFTGRNVVYVAEGSSGSGSRQSPFGSVRDAVRAATPGTTIAIHTGTYVGGVTLRDDVHLAGACASGVTITATSSTSVLVTGDDVRIDDVAVAGGLDVVGTASIAGVRFDAPDAIVVRGALGLSNALIHGGDEISGIYVEGRLSATDVHLVGGRQGVFCRDAAIDVQRAVVTDAETGFGVSANCRAVVAELRVEEAADGFVVDADADATVTDAYFRSEPAPAEDVRRTALVAYGALLTAQRIYIEGAAGVAVTSARDGRIVAEELFVRDVWELDGASTVAFAIGEVTLSRFAFTGDYEEAISLTEEARANLFDGVIEKSRRGDTAVLADAGTTLELARVRIEGRFTNGVRVEDGSHLISLEDLEVRGAVETPLFLSPAEGATAQRIRVEGATLRGILVQTFLNDDDIMALSDVDIRCGPQADGFDGKFGSALTLDRFEIHGCGNGVLIGAPFFGALRDGVVADNAAGIAIADQLELIRFTHDVRFERNDRLSVPLIP